MLQHLSSPQACRFGHVQHLEHLLFYGANMGAQNASGNTALHICALYNQVYLETHPLQVHLHFLCVVKCNCIPAHTSQPV